jgi:hypothetical protein
VTSVREIRSSIRTTRLSHKKSPRLSRAGDLYMIALGLFIWGGITLQAIRRLLDSPPHLPAITNLPTAQWLLASAGVLGLSLAIRAMLVAGPVVAGGAFQFWLLAAPLDRRGLLTRRFWWTAVITTSVGGLLGLGSAALLRGSLEGKLTTTVACAALAASAFVLTVVLQSRPDGASLGRRLSFGLSALAILMAAATLTMPLPVINLPFVLVAAVLLPISVILFARAYAILGALNRAALSTGTEMVMAAQVSVNWMDVSLFTSIAEIRKWRRIGRVSSRKLHGSRYFAMLGAEITRTSRARAALAIWAGLLLVPYAVAQVLPATFVPTAQLFLATFAISPFAIGLRNLGRSPALQRNLGGSNLGQRLTHLVVPSTMALLWTALTFPAAGIEHWLATALSPVGAVLYVYRHAVRKPTNYDPGVVDSPFGLMPLNTIWQLIRGPLLLLLIAAIQLNL